MRMQHPHAASDVLRGDVWQRGKRMADEVFLKLEGIKKSFGGVHALQGVDLEIRKGEIHCLAGENGCGKSTLIKAISGVHVPDEGSIRIDGEEMKNMKPMDAINRGIQVILWRRISH